MAVTKDAVLDAAVDLARQAAEEVAEHPEHVGEHLGLVQEGERLVSHRFACTARGYRGWAWTVTLSRVPRGRAAAVSETHLLPGEDAILAPAWVPWADRLQPGDIGPGDVLPFRADDPRLEPGWTPSGDEDLDAVAIGELALARVRVLSPAGRDEAAQRWYNGSHGPMTKGSLAASAACASCGFWVPLGGALGQVFGACTNDWSPDDGRVVSMDHGCGAHSETDVENRPSEWPAPVGDAEDMDVDVIAEALGEDVVGDTLASVVVDEDTVVEETVVEGAVELVVEDAAEPRVEAPGEPEAPVTGDGDVPTDEAAAAETEVDDAGTPGDPAGAPGETEAPPTGEGDDPA